VLADGEELPEPLGEEGELPELVPPAPGLPALPLDGEGVLPGLLALWLL
jgi:hypothetical protein